MKQIRCTKSLLNTGDIIANRILSVAVILMQKENEHFNKIWYPKDLVSFFVPTGLSLCCSS